MADEIGVDELDDAGELLEHDIHLHKLPRMDVGDDGRDEVKLVV